MNLSSVKTTIDIPDDLLSSLFRLSGAKTKRDAVLVALEDYTRRRMVSDLISTFGTWDMMDNDELEAPDLIDHKLAK
jgi:Arc/MetJ family transcription regulator